MASKIKKFFIFRTKEKVSANVIKRAYTSLHFILLFFSSPRIIISGASGADGRKNQANGKADQIRALVHLEANETLFILVGQMGSSACEQTGVSLSYYSIFIHIFPFF